MFGYPLFLFGETWHIKIFHKINMSWIKYTKSKWDDGYDHTFQIWKLKIKWRTGPYITWGITWG